MTMEKYAAAEVLDARMGRRHRRFQRKGHRARFNYTPEPGILYVRSRAISSRCNDNYDEFPAEEIKKGYRSFIGKPVFVNHNNDDHRRARGVVIDAALHEDTNPDGSPDTWAEVLMAVDATKFPKLAQAILAGHIDRTSMGVDVEYSHCSVCGNRAENPVQYCRHIPTAKGQIFRRKNAATGAVEDVLCREKCFGLGFFENSLLVEEPADPTAYTLGLDTRGLQMAASKSAGRWFGNADPEWYDGESPGVWRAEFQPAVYMLIVSLANEAWFDASRPAAKTPDGFFWCVTSSPVNQASDIDAAYKEDTTTGQAPSLGAAQKAVKPVANDLMNSLHERWKTVGYNETMAPAKVDTLRDAECPVCHEDTAYDGEQCAVCGFIKPPEMFQDPDVDKAKQEDLRQDDQDQDPQAQDGDPSAYVPPNAQAAPAQGQDQGQYAPPSSSYAPPTGEAKDDAPDEDQASDEDGEDGKKQPPWMKKNESLLAA